MFLIHFVNIACHVSTSQYTIQTWIYIDREILEQYIEKYGTHNYVFSHHPVLQIYESCHYIKVQHSIYIWN
jgi:hypothetical protein